MSHARAFAMLALGEETSEEHRQGLPAGGFIIVLAGTPPFPQGCERVAVMVPDALTLGELMRAADGPREEDSYFFERMPEAHVLTLNVGWRDFGHSIPPLAACDTISATNPHSGFDWQEEQNRHGPPPRRLGPGKHGSKQVLSPRVAMRRG